MQLDKKALDLLFYQARTHNIWQDKQIEDKLLYRLCELTMLCPTSANSCPLRIIFLKSTEAKKRLEPYLMPANRVKSMTAPVVTILAMDREFQKKLPKLHAPNPHIFARASEEILYDTTFRNSSLQGGYFILAARGLGLDCGPMSGFDSTGVNREFLANTTHEVNFICNIGYGKKDHPYERLPRLAFEEFATII